MKTPEYIVVTLILVLSAVIICAIFGPARKPSAPATGWDNIGTIPDGSELVILPTGERLLILTSFRGLCAVVLPPIPVEKTP